MARFEHFNELKHLSATTLCAHLREELGLKSYTKDEGKKLGKQGLVDAVVESYKYAGLPLLGAPGWPWTLTAGQKPANAPAAPRTTMTAKDQSAALAGKRLKQLEDKHFEMPVDADGKPLIDPMHMTGPGYVHPRFWSYPALPKGQEYRVAVVFDPQGKESTQQTHLALNGRALIAQRDQVVFVPAEYIDGVVNNARGKIDEGIGANKELNIDQSGGDLKLRPFRAEHMVEVGEAVTDQKGVRLKWLRRFDGKPIDEEGMPYGAAAPGEQQAHAG